jgi:hypothetical protein
LSKKPSHHPTFGRLFGYTMDEVPTVAYLAVGIGCKLPPAKVEEWQYKINTAIEIQK